MTTCDYCQHVEMCGWRKELNEQGCEFYDDGNRWIPVSERLPEKEGRYLTTILNEYANELRYVMTCDYFSNGCWCPDDECASSNVVAWMPLPELYKESEDKE